MDKRALCLLGREGQCFTLDKGGIMLGVRQRHAFEIICICKLCARMLSCSVMSNSVRPDRQQPTRLPCPWDSQGKNTGVGCHFLLQCMKVKSESEVAQSCLTLSDPMDFSLLGSSIHGIFQARVLEWGAIAFSKENGNGDIYINNYFKCKWTKCSNQETQTG